MTRLERWAVAGLVIVLAAWIALTAKPAFLIGVLIFVFALLISIMLHEFGHFVTAKLFGMQVTQFFVGFWKTIWSRRVGETEYGVKALPIGGFVKITGMTVLEDVTPDDEPRSFRRQPGWQRAIVLVAGSFMHFALAFVLLFGLAVGLGLQNANTTAIGAVTSCVPASVQALDSGSCAGSPGRSPARLAGLRASDKIVSIGGTPVSNWTQVGKVIRAAPVGQPLPIVVLRDGHRLTLIAHPAHVAGRSGSYLGIGPAVIFQRIGPLSAISFAASTFGQTITQSGSALGRLPAAIPDLFAKDRAKTPAGNVSSIVGAADYAGQAASSGRGWEYTLSLLLLIIIELNIFVGIFNLLPLLPLDGGHLAIVIAEQVRTWWARIRRRPEPGLLDITKLLPVSVAVFSLLVGLSMLLILADIFNPVHLA